MTFSRNFLSNRGAMPIESIGKSLERLEPRVLYSVSPTDQEVTPPGFTRCDCGCGGFLFALAGAVEAGASADGLPRGLVATFWSNNNFTGDNIARVEPNIDLVGAPEDLLDGQEFSARWEGKVIPNQSGAHTFSVGVIGSAKLWIDGQLLIDTSKGGPCVSSPIELQAGEKYDLRMDFSGTSLSADAQTQLMWATEADPEAEVIPFNALTPMIAAATVPVKVNFQPAGAAIPGGYVPDSGLTYGDRGNGMTFGWNIDLSDDARDRNSAQAGDQRYDTLNHMQRYGAGVWEFALPNGEYDVKIVAGDSDFFDSVYRINVEGTLAVNGTPTIANRFIEGNVTVNVADGKLTLANASGAANNKINFVEITPTSLPNVAPTVMLTAPPSGAVFSAGSSIALGADASDSDGNVTKVEFFQGNTKIGEDLTAPYTFTWSSVPAGNYTLTARATDNDAETTISSAVSITVNSAGAQSPYLGSPVAVGTRIEAENFDTGGEGVAFHDLETTNKGNAPSYRATGVDVQTTTDAGGGYSVGFIRQSEWLEYTVQVPSAGNYTLEIRVASGGAGGTFHVDFGGVNKTGTLTLPNTGSWTTWQTVTKTVSLSAGTQVLRIAFDSGSGDIGNVNYLRLVSTPVGGTPAAPSNLTTDNVFSEQVNLAWTDSANNESGFRIERKLGSNGSWSEVGTVPANTRAYFDSNVSPNTSYFYRVRAYNASGNSGYTAEINATTTRDLTWSTFGQSPIGRMEPGSTEIGSKLYILGGFISNFSLTVSSEMWQWDVSNNTWTRLADIPGSQTHMSVANDGVNIYKAAGQLGDGTTPGNGDNRVWKYTPLTNSWSPLPSLPAPRYGGYLAYLNGTLEFFTGDDNGRTDPVADHWRLDLNNLAAGWVTRAPVPFPGDHISGAVLNGKIYLIGGEHSHGVDYIQHRYVQEYDPIANTWRQRTEIPTFGLSHVEGTTFVSDGRIVMVGGMYKKHTNTAEVKVWDPVSDQWLKLASIPVARKGSTGILWAGKYYTVTGEAPGTISRDIFVTNWPVAG